MLLTTLCGCSDGVPQTKDVNILILSVDTLRADRLGLYGNDDWDVSPSPTIDALGAEGVTFDQALVPRGQTRPSIAALFSGKYPITTGVRENGFMLLDEHITFMQRLQAGGHQTGVFVSNFEETKRGANWIYRGADVQRGGSTGHSSQRAPEPQIIAQAQWDQTVEEAAIDFLDKVDTARPFASYVHFYDVHKPFNPPAGYDRYGKYAGMPEALEHTQGPPALDIERHIDEITLSDRDVPDDELQRIFGLYDGTVTATDDRIARILAKLDEIGERENTYIIVTADHGEELFDHNRYFYHGNSVYNGVVGVPLVIAGPGLPEAARRSMPVLNMDVTATIYDLAGLPQPADIEGFSLVDALHGRSDEVRPFAFVEWKDIVFGATDGRYSYIHNPDHARLMKPPFFGTDQSYMIRCYEGYDLANDYLQQNDILQAYAPATLANVSGLPGEFGPLRTALDEWLDDPSHEKELSWPGIEREKAEELNAQEKRNNDLALMGYLPVTALQHISDGECPDEQ